jgi:hypothetical protein
MRCKRRIKFAIGCGAMLAMLGGCAGGSHASFCLLYAPVYTAASDSPITRRQVDGNNAVWQALCEQ